MLHKMLLEEMITCYSLDLEIKTAYGKELKIVWKFETDLPGNSIANIINVSYITLKISKEFRNYAEEEKNLVHVKFLVVICLMIHVFTPREKIF